TPIDAWRAGDQWIDEDNIQGLRYYSSGCEIRLGPNSHFETHQKNTDKPFRDWLTSQGYHAEMGKNWYIDRKGIKQGFGHLIIAKCPPQQFGSLSIEEVQQRIAHHPYL